jgi:lactoylglutathione lyase
LWIVAYRDTLGLPLLAADEAFGYARVDGGSVAIGLGAGEPNPDLGVHVGIHTGISFSVPDVDDAYEALTAKGVTFSMPPTRQGWGAYRAMFLDPDRNVQLMICSTPPARSTRTEGPEPTRRDVCEGRQPQPESADGFPSRGDSGVFMNLAAAGRLICSIEPDTQ